MPSGAEEYCGKGWNGLYLGDRGRPAGNKGLLGVPYFLFISCVLKINDTGITKKR